MPYKCTVRGCNGNTKNGPKVQVFGFPKDPLLSEKWARAIGKEADFVPSYSSKVCELHFMPDDIRRESYAVDESTGQVVSSAKLKVPQLIKGAIPSVLVSYQGPDLWRRRRRRKVDDDDIPVQELEAEGSDVNATFDSTILNDGESPLSIQSVYSIDEKVSADGTGFPGKRGRTSSYCSVPNCDSKGPTAATGLRFHCFPPPGQMAAAVNEMGIKVHFDRRQMWISRLGMERPVTKCMLVCSRHFLRSDYILPDSQKKTCFLKKNAIPSANLPSSSSGFKPMKPLAVRGFPDGQQVPFKAIKLLPINQLLPTVLRVTAGPGQTTVLTPVHNVAEVPGGILSQVLRMPKQGASNAPLVSDRVPLVHQVVHQAANMPQVSTASRSEDVDPEGTGAIVPDLDWKLVGGKRKPSPEDDHAAQVSSNRLPDDMVVSCRTCFGACRSARKIFADHEPGVPLYKTINDIYELNIVPGDGLAEHVCDSCFQSVLRFQRFRSTSNQSHVALTSIKKKLSEDKVKSMDNLCRLCVNQSNMFGHIFDQKHRGVHVYEIINDLCRLNVCEDDGLPAWLCEGCHGEVVEFSDCKRFAHRDAGEGSTNANEFSEDDGLVDDGGGGFEGRVPEDGDEDWMPEEGEEEDIINNKDGDMEGEDEDEEEDGGISIDSFLETKLEEGTNLELSVEEAAEGNQSVVTTTPSREAEMPTDPMHRKRSEKWGLKKFSCHICKKPFALRHHLTIHVRTHTGEKPYRCKFCNKPFASHSGLSVHVRIHTGHKPHVCNVCGKRFTQSGTAKEHAKIHLEERQHKCEQCGKAFAQKRTYLNHVKSHERDTPVKCGVCGTMLASMANWRKHHALVHLERRPYKCDVCEKEFASSWSFRSHYRMHSGEKPYECKVCLMRFANPSSYKLHLRKH
ncbi:uncharacterized protein LOC124172639 isoform X2 [Ischnura elegans]|uniref:uncharacterized protein LOC124172639 isoform X2 n=1 Tax=Ischnura elegans TaxID=197161 RepID=UPI001ED87583|nr:uncharacterized protein LOC124172639 isoform X2 [Ischnura elegans]